MSQHILLTSVAVAVLHLTHHDVSVLLVVIPVNMKKPESAWPMLVYTVPDFPGVVDGTEHKGLYILCDVDKRFEEFDGTVDWYTGCVCGGNDKMLHFKVPAFPFPLFPNVTDGEWLYQGIQSQVGAHVQKSMNDAHANLDDQEAVTLEKRKWQDIVLDFSHCDDFDYFDSNCLCADAGPKKTLDFDVIDVPLKYSGPNSIQAWQSMYGFKVGCMTDGPVGARKTKRSGQQKSQAQKKREEKERQARMQAEALRQRQQQQQQQPQPMNQGSSSY